MRPQWQHSKSGYIFETPYFSCVKCTRRDGPGLGYHPHKHQSSPQTRFHLWAGSFHFPSLARCFFCGKPARPGMLPGMMQLKWPIPWSPHRLRRWALRSRSRCGWAWWRRLLAIICLHYLPRLESFGKTGARACRQGACAPPEVQNSSRRICAMYGVSGCSMWRFNPHFQVHRSKPLGKHIPKRGCINC